MPAGHDTKVFQNSTAAPSKRSRLELRVDVLVIALFALLLIWCLVNAIYFAIWTQRTSPKHWYLAPNNTEGVLKPSNPTYVGFAAFISGFILYGGLHKYCADVLDSLTMYCP
jgi:hypothetical protein